MLALYRAGRQAEALEVCRETRRVLDEQLGLEPSAALRDLERAILQQDPALNAPRVPPSPTPPEAPQRRRRSRLKAAVIAITVGAAALAALAAWEELHPTPAKPAAGPTAVEQPHSRAAPHPSRVHPITDAPVSPEKAGNHQHVKRVRTAIVHATSVEPASTVVKKVVPTQTAPPRQTPKTATTKTTAAKQTVPKQPTTPAIQPDLVTLSDDFSTLSTTSTMWGIGNDGTGGTASQANGQLDLTLSATGVPGGRDNQIGVEYFTQCRFGGDFDARVNYNLLDWPTGSGARLQLSAWILPNANSDAARESSTHGEQYGGDVGSLWASIPTTDQQGVLRVARRGATLTTYFLQNGRWTALKSGPARGQVTIGLQLFAAASDWTHQEVDAAFDNFTVTAQRPTCS
jgi:hypothetical protein